MLRTLPGRVVLRQVKDVLVVVGGQPSNRISLPPFCPSVSFFSHFPSPSIHFVSCRHHHLASLQSCHSSRVVTSNPLPLSPPPPSIPSMVLSAQLSTSPLCLKIRSKVDSEDSSKVKKKAMYAPFITLIDTEDKISKMGLDQAERLAKRRDLKLVKVDDPTLTQGTRDVYRLLTGKQYLEDQIKAKRREKKSPGTKDEKILALGGNISQHDLAFKLQSVIKWINKGHQVKVTIAVKKSPKEDVEKIFSTIEDEVKNHKGRILQRHEKNNDIRFYIAPPKVKAKNVTNKETTLEDDHASTDESSSEQIKS